jgi:hypothetical protein
VVHRGQPVNFPEGSDPSLEPSLELFHEKGESFEIPLNPDRSFRIKWMPIGKHSATLLRRNKTGMGPPETRYNIPGRFAASGRGSGRRCLEGRNVPSHGTNRAVIQSRWDIGRVSFRGCEWSTGSSTRRCHLRNGDPSPFTFRT